MTGCPPAGKPEDLRENRAPRPRLLLGAPGSGCGKTAVTCGLLRIFVRRKIPCMEFKCGPDYIDPMFHQSVLGVEGGNLDTYFLSEREVREVFARRAPGVGISVIEGVMGYYDGVGGTTVQASSYEVAAATDTPAVLILDGRGMSLSAAALAGGFARYRQDSHLRGVILNRVSPSMAERLAPAFEAEGLKLFGFLPECEAAKLDSRHLGLKLPGELEGLKGQIDRLADQMERTVDIGGLMDLAESAPELQKAGERAESGPRASLLLSGIQDRPAGRAGAERVKIGVARDPAFCFYYQENLRMLEEAGAELIPFSPLLDRELPEELGGLLLGGGYPELWAAGLSGNQTMRESVRQAVLAGMPVLAECGGFLYLHEELEDDKGVFYPMAGVIRARAFRGEKLLRFGYVEVSAGQDTAYLKAGEAVRGHEFHYWDSTDPGTGMWAQKPGKNRGGWNCLHAAGNLLAGFPHLYYPSAPDLPGRFAAACTKWKRGGIS